MNGFVDLPGAGIPPDPRSVLRGQGIPDDANLPDRVRTLVDDARELYRSLAEPRGRYVAVSGEEFRAIYLGDGRNARRTPLEAIFPRAERLALFAVTLGEPVSRRIGELFAESEPALGYMLDAVASDRADAAADMIGGAYLDRLARDGDVGPSARVLPYSPGYCGWHITGQRALFARLEPGKIGITLNDSCLMQPLKSVSGLLAVGRPEIHEFDNDFDFCDACTTYACRSRIGSISGPPADHGGVPRWKP